MEMMRGEQNNGEYEESDTYISVKANLKKHLSFWEKAIRANETVCDILKKRLQITFSLHPLKHGIQKQFFGS